MYLGPVVAAQQVLDPSPQTRYPRKEKKGGHICYNQVFRSLIPGSRYRFTFQDVTGKVIFISRREGDYEMMPVCACVRVCVCVHALVCHADFSKTTTATDFFVN